MKNLIVFGDSWPAGSGLQDPQKDSFPTILAQKLNLNCKNLSQRSTSIDHAVNVFLKTDLTDSMVLFCTTGYARTMKIDCEQLSEVHPQDPAMEWYYTRLYSDELGKLNRIKNCLLVQEICRNKRIPVYFVSNWDPVPFHDLLDQAQWSPKTFMQMISAGSCNPDAEVDWSTVNRKYMIYHTSHPNEAGHRLIAEELHTWISSR
jgi:hypothetical protein